MYVYYICLSKFNIVTDHLIPSKWPEIVALNRLEDIKYNIQSLSLPPSLPPSFPPSHLYYFFIERESNGIILNLC